MDSVINRHRNVANVVVLVFVLFVQVVGLAVQVKRPSDSGGTRLIRVWAVTLVTPLSKGVVHAEESISGVPGTVTSSCDMCDRRTRICRISWRGCAYSRCDWKKMRTRRAACRCCWGSKNNIFRRRCRRR